MNVSSSVRTSHFVCEARASYSSLIRLKYAIGNGRAEGVMFTARWRDVALSSRMWRIYGVDSDSGGVMTWREEPLEGSQWASCSREVRRRGMEVAIPNEKIEVSVFGEEGM